MKGHVRKNITKIEPVVSYISVGETCYQLKGDSA